MIKQEENKKKKLILGIIACFGGLFVHLIIGSLYQWGVVSVYYTSYFHAKDQGVTLESTAIAFPLMMACIGLTMRLGLFLAVKTHPIILMTVGQVLCASVVFVSSFMTTFWLFILFYGILFGLFAGLSFMIPIYECNNYLVGKKIYVNGLILIGTGCGPVVFGLFSYFYINPNKVAPLNGLYFGDPQLQDISQKVPDLLKWLSLMYLCIGLLGVLMLAPVCVHNRRVQLQLQRLRKEAIAQQNIQLQRRIEDIVDDDQQCTIIQTQQQVSQRQQSLRQIQQQISNNKKIQQITTRHSSRKTLEKQVPPQPQPELKHVNQAHSIKQAMASKVFWVSIILLLISSCGCFMINGNYKLYVKGIILDDFFLTVIGVVGAVGNGCSRFFWSLLLNKTGFKTVLLIIIGICVGVYVSIRFAKFSEVGYLVEIFLINCCLGGFMVSTPTAVHCLYGHKTGSNIYGIYWQVFAGATFLGYIYISFLAKAIDFDNVIYVCLAMSAISAPFIACVTFQGPWKNDTTYLEFCVGRQLMKKKTEEENVFEIRLEPKKVKK